MRQPPIYSSRYGMAVPAPAEQGYRMHKIRSLRWAEISDALRRVMDGVRMNDDFAPNGSDVSPADPAGSHAGASTIGRRSV